MGSVGSGDEVAAAGKVLGSNEAISAARLASLPMGEVGRPSLKRDLSLFICCFIKERSSFLLAARSSNFSLASSAGAFAAFCTPIKAVVDGGAEVLPVAVSPDAVGISAAGGVSVVDGFVGVGFGLTGSAGAAAGTIDVCGAEVLAPQPMKKRRESSINL